MFGFFFHILFLFRFAFSCCQGCGGGVLAVGVTVDKLLEQMAREHANSKQKDPTSSRSNDTASYCTSTPLITSSYRTRFPALTGNSVLYDSASSAEATLPVYRTQHSKHNTAMYTSDDKAGSHTNELTHTQMKRYILPTVNNDD